MTPTVSIVMPVRDTAPYLRQCVQSIIDQSFEHWELLAVNDNSTDDSLDVLTSLSEGETRIKVIDNTTPGLINALRKGYNASIGTLITRMDSDDKMPVNKLSNMVSTWEEAGKGTVVTGSVEYFSDHEKLGGGYIRYADWINKVIANSDFNNQLYKECVIPSCCWMVHREDFERIGGFEPDTFPEDYDLCFRFVHGKFNIISVKEVLHYWRDRPDRISRTMEVYKDNRFYKLKLNYFMKNQRDASQPLVVWGAGRNGKDLSKSLLEYEQNFLWVCDNERKIGKEIYGHKLKSVNEVQKLINPQILVAVASNDDQVTIKKELMNLDLKEGSDFWFFL